MQGASVCARTVGAGVVHELGTCGATGTDVISNFLFNA